MASLGPLRATLETYGPAQRTGDPRFPTSARPLGSCGSFRAVFSIDVHAFTALIKGLQLHVRSAFAQRTAKHEALCMQDVLDPMLLLVIMDA